MGKKWFAALTILAVILIICLVLFLFRGFILNKLVENVVFKEGRPTKFGNYTVSIDKIEGNKLFGITVTDNNRKLEAKSGEYVYIPKENTIKFKLNDGIAEDVSVENPRMFNRLTFKQYYMTLKLKTLLPKLKEQFK